MTTEVTTAGVSSAAPVVRHIPVPRREDERPDTDRSGPSQTQTRLCRCGHAVEAHEHFRPGSDCGACGAAQCGRFRAPGRPRLWSRLRRRP
jgi:hypothetical protein